MQPSTVLEGAPARRILDRRDTGGIESSQTGTWGALAGGKGISRQERRSTRAKPPSRPFSEWPTIRSEGIDYWLAVPMRAGRTVREKAVHRILFVRKNFEYRCQLCQAWRRVLEKLKRIFPQVNYSTIARDSKDCNDSRMM